MVMANALVCEGNLVTECTVSRCLYGGSILPAEFGFAVEFTDNPPAPVGKSVD